MMKLFTEFLRSPYSIVMVHGLRSPHSVEACFRTDLVGVGQCIHHEFNSTAVFSKEGFHQEATSLLRRISESRDLDKVLFSSPD